MTTANRIKEVQIYSGGTYCGNGIFETLSECIEFFNNDPYADKAVIYDAETGKKTTIKKNN